MKPAGLLAVFKPCGWTSNDVVQKIKGVLSKYQEKELVGWKKKKDLIKVGHGGTLDPMAQGILVLGVGSGTKLMGEYLTGTKGYVVGAILGEERDTLDSTGAVLETAPFAHVEMDHIEKNLEQFRGDIMQTPPMFSALKKDGVRLYDLARKGISVDRSARPVTVYDLKLRRTSDSFGAVNPLPEFSLQLECSGGFYVRSLVSDLAKACDSRAHMTSLIRTKNGPFLLKDCLVEADWNYEGIIAGLERCNHIANIAPELLEELSKKEEPNKIEHSPFKLHNKQGNGRFKPQQ